MTAQENKQINIWVT